MIGERRGPVQPVVGAAEPARAGRRGGTADLGRGGAAQRPVGAVDAVHGADELERLGGGKAAREALGRAAAGPSADPAGVEVAEDRRVVVVMGPYEGRPGRVDEAAVARGGDEHARVLVRLRSQVLAEVRLVPDLPVADAGQAVVA